MSKLPGNGFQSRAPVLPGLGLHSFHNDSPPFAPASQHASHEPEFLQLDGGPPTSRPLTPSEYHSNITSPGEGRPSTSSSSQPVPIQAQGQVQPTVPQPQRPSASRIPTSSADDYLAVSRSKRLVSGYTFGPPVDPDTHDTLENPEDTADPSSDPSHTTPPSQTRDSTPVSTVSSSPQQSEVGVLESNMERIKLEERDSDLKRRRDSKSIRARDKEIGYDALAGLNDGEADADENAMPASFGTRQYLLGEEGEAGEYRFPKHRLRTKMKDESKIPIVIVACGSFSPPTYLHLRMFEMAKDEVVESQTYEIMAGYYSPVSSYYKKAGLAPAIHRVRMCELAVEHTSTWLMVDPWEAGQPEYTRTAVVLEHFNEMLNVQEGGLVMSDGKRRRYKIMLLAGGDLIESFGEPGVWSEPDLHIILGRFGCLIVERAGSDVWAFLLSHDILYHHRRNVIVIKQLIYNDISSTKVRLFVKRGMSIKYLLPNSVIQYIYDNKLYRAPEGLAAIGAGCGKDEGRD